MPETIQREKEKSATKVDQAPDGGCPGQCKREEGNAAIKVSYKSRSGARGDAQDRAEGKKERRL